MILAPISVGELIDKITILRIKTQLITDHAKLKNIEQELQLLEELKDTVNMDPRVLDPLEHELYGINLELWHIENFKRSCERLAQFNDEFVQAARDVYLKNDARASIKREINLISGSAIVEEKSHTR